MNFPIVLRFTDAKTQDLLLAVSQKLGESPIETIQSVICNERTVEAISEGWGIIALSLWGHGENKFDDDDFAKLDEPELEVPLSEDQVANLIAYADSDESVKSIEDLVGVFLIFEADALGFHV